MSSQPHAPSDDALAHSERLRALIHAQIDEAGGAIPFWKFMELALYAPGLGYYSAGSTKFGEAGDFTTVERDALSKVGEAEVKDFAEKDAVFAKVWGFNVPAVANRQATFVNTALRLFAVISEEEAAKARSSADFKEEQLVIRGDRRLLQTAEIRGLDLVIQFDQFAKVLQARRDAAATTLRDALTREAAHQVTRLTKASGNFTPIGEIVDEKSLVNSIVALNATGGSTNHTLHMPAIAMSAGIILTWQDMADLSEVVPTLSHVYPNGKADINHFQAAGGMSFLIRELLEAGLLHDDVNTVAGKGLSRYVQEPFLVDGELVWRDGPIESLDETILRPVARAFSPEGGRIVIEIRKAPEGADWSMEVSIADNGRGMSAQEIALAQVDAMGHVADRVLERVLARAQEGAAVEVERCRAGAGSCSVGHPG